MAEVSSDRLITSCRICRDSCVAYVATHDNGRGERTRPDQTYLIANHETGRDDAASGEYRLDDR